MKKSTIITLAVVGVLAVAAVVIGSMWVSAHNREVALRNAITAKQKDNTSEFDNMFKKISQSAQVTEGQKNALKEIFVSYAQARGGVQGNAVMKWLQESVPNVDTSTFKNLQNIITASRDAWTMRQKELLDLKREHDNIRTQFPTNLFVGGRPAIEVTIVTSSRTDESFKTGKDDNTKVF
ncbi:MAG: hypothetical protein ABFE07_28735 [Armatimonadia bacterium]